MLERKLPHRKLELTEEERAYLQRSRDREQRAYLREQAAALLKIADGKAPYWVALHGLLKPRHPETVYGWLNHFQQHRILHVRPACRRAFFPSGRKTRGGAANHSSDAAGSRKDAHPLDAGLAAPVK